MSNFPDRSGIDAPKRSQEGSEAVPERLGRLQRCSLIVIRSAILGGLTAHETATATGFDRAAIQPRITELRHKGFVVASGMRRRNPSGKTATVWIASEYVDPDGQMTGQ